MSLNPRHFEPVRLEYHAGKLFTDQDIRGADRSFDDLQRAYMIAILGKERFFPDGGFFHAFEYYDPERRVSLGGRSQIITLELSKLEKVVEKPVMEMDVKEEWAVYFRYLKDKDKRWKINEIIEREEGIAMASQVLITVSKDEEERARLFSENKYILDRQSELVTAKREGRAEGRKEGRQEGIVIGEQKGRQEIINMLKSGKSPEEIIKSLS
jgi:predicted transposase/invertase (TIGR01784 family)